MLRAVSQHFDKVIANARNGVRSGYSEGVRESGEYIDRGRTRKRSFVVMVAKDTCVWYLTGNQEVCDLEESLGGISLL